jgi:predicted transcriptional regulator YheO
MTLYTLLMRNYDDHLIREATKLVTGLGKMFAPFCEVVLHDLRTPEHAIAAIENNLSGRRIGDPTTNLGMERIKSTDFQDIVQNYPNTLPNGRQVKSTSIGIRNQQGICIASICLNFDISAFSSLNAQLGQFIATSTSQLSIPEQLTAVTSEEIRRVITAYAAQKNLAPTQLTAKDRRSLVQDLNERGLFKLRNAVTITAQSLRVTRPTIYNYLKDTQ